MARVSTPHRIAIWIALVQLPGALAPRHAVADIQPLIWEPVEVVDQPVEFLPSASGSAAVFADGKWHVVYVKNYNVRYRSRDAGGWSGESQVSLVDTADVRDPHIAAGAGQILVAWQDSRTGHPEVWTRRLVGGTWQAEECMTCDAFPSGGPGIAGGSVPMVVWETDSLGVRHVRGRVFENGAWGPVEMISTSTLGVHDPSVTALKYFDGSVVAWTQDDAPAAQIHTRTRSDFQGGWSDEHAVPFDGSCSHPSVHAEGCCGDVVIPNWSVAFEAQGECWSADQDDNVRPVSPSGELVAVRPNMGGLTFYGPWPATLTPEYLATWSDAIGPGFYRHGLIDLRTGESETLAPVGLAHALIAGADGSPRAPVLALWLELRAGVPTLVARSGSLPGNLDVPAPEPMALRLTAHPNPARDHVSLRILGHSLRGARVRVVDAAGRAIRDLGDTGEIREWDLRDDDGRAVRSGRYFALADLGGRRLWRAVVVIR